MKLGPGQDFACGTGGEFIWGFGYFGVGASYMWYERPVEDGLGLA